MQCLLNGAPEPPLLCLAVVIPAAKGDPVDGWDGLLHHVTAPDLSGPRMHQHRMMVRAAFNPDAIGPLGWMNDGKVDAECTAIARGCRRQTQALNIRRDRVQESVVRCNGPRIVTTLLLQRLFQQAMTSLMLFPRHGDRIGQVQLQEVSGLLRAN